MPVGEILHLFSQWKTPCFWMAKSLWQFQFWSIPHLVGPSNYLNKDHQTPVNSRLCPINPTPFKNYRHIMYSGNVGITITNHSPVITIVGMSTIPRKIGGAYGICSVASNQPIPQHSSTSGHHAQCPPGISAPQEFPSGWLERRRRSPERSANPGGEKTQFIPRKTIRKP